MRKFVDNVPRVKRPRASFPLDHIVSTTMSMGKLYPVDIQEILPGDTWKQNHAFIARATSALIRPIMADLYLDVYTFFVPLRILQQGAENVFADQSSTRWYQYPTDELAHFEDDSLTIPSSGVCSSKTVGDYLGVPVGAADIDKMSVLPFRAFAHVWNEWFRKETVMDQTAVFDTDKAQSTEAMNNLPWSVINYTGKLPPVSKYVDLFTSCTVEPQLGPAVPFAVTPMPVIAGAERGSDTAARPHFVNDTDDEPSGQITVYGGNASFDYSSSFSDDEAAYIDNLYADPSAVSVNELRMQTALQRMAEIDAFGQRYKEYLYFHYGVENGDARLQVPELLSRSHQPLSIQSVVQTSGQGTALSDPDDPDSLENTEDLGTVAGYSVTTGANAGKFVKSFTEHGYIMTVAAIRQKHLYSQGLPPLFGRTKKEHFYDPVFAHLGAQPVWMSEIYALSGQDSRGDVFGYNECWANYRVLQDRVSGEMRPQIGGQVGLGDLWTLADYYASKPTLSGLIPETADRLDQVLTVPSTSQDQFAIDFKFFVTAARVMPEYGTPSDWH